MIVTFYSFLMATIMGSILILIYSLLKRYYFFIINLGLNSLVILAALCALRLVLPVEFPKYQYVIGIDMGAASTEKVSSFENALKVLIVITILGCIL